MLVFITCINAAGKWRLAFLVLAAVLNIATAGPTLAADARLKIKYVISLSGLKVGELRLIGGISRTDYSLKGSGKISGLPQLFTTFKGEARSSGTIAERMVRPATHSIAYNTIKKDYATRMRFEDRSVTSLDLIPPYKVKKSRVPVLREHKLNVIDPLSSVILPGPAAGDLMGPASCDHTLPIFDGRERFDMTLVYKGLGQVDSGDGYKGPVVVCQVDYTPIAGHRREDKLVDTWSQTGAIEVWLAPVPEANVLVLYRAKVPTPFGSAVVHPKAFLVKPATPRG